MPNGSPGRRCHELPTPLVDRFTSAQRYRGHDEFAIVDIQLMYGVGVTEIDPPRVFDD
jgi:hypothetical protein